MCENLVTTSEVTDALEKTKTFFKKINSWNYGRLGTSSICSVKSNFTTLVNVRALLNISAPCVLHRHALASKALPEYLKIV